MTDRSAARSLVVITGGSGGIGLELARLAARDGHELLLAARGEAALAHAAVALRDGGASAVHVVVADVATNAGIDAVVAAVEELDLPLATLVNNAGVGHWGPFADQDVDRIGSMVDLNCRTVAVLTRRLLARIEAARGGVLTVASMAAFQPGPGMCVYHATKSFALAFSVGLREELRGTGVHVTALCPGPVPTAFAGTAGVEGADETRLARLATQPADRVARLGWTGLRRNRAVVVPGGVNRISSIGAKLAPLTVTTRIARSALGAIGRR